MIKKLSVYDLSVESAYEKINNVCKKTNEVIDTVNTFNENMLVVDFDCTTGNLIICARKDVPVVNNAKPSDIWESDF